MPSNLVDAAGSEGRLSWLASVPDTVRSVAQRWDLEVGEPFLPGGRIAWVAPARSPVQPDLVLKIAWRHPEAEHEADGLRTWNGQGAVRLHAADELDDDTVALLLERCRPGLALATRPEEEQDTIIARLLHRLWVTPDDGHSFPSLGTMCETWADAVEARGSAARANVEPGLARAGLALFRTLPATSDRAVLLCTDLHAGNVLAAKREPWLVIDPKPHMGDPTYDALQHLLNCDERLQSEPHRVAQRMADLLGLDPDRLLLWLFARCVLESPDSPWLGEVARRLAPQ